MSFGNQNDYQNPNQGQKMFKIKQKKPPLYKIKQKLDANLTNQLLNLNNQQILNFVRHTDKKKTLPNLRKELNGHFKVFTYDIQ